MIAVAWMLSSNIAVAASQKDGKPLTGRRVYQRLTQHRTGRTSASYRRVIVGFGAFSRLGSSVHDTLSGLINAGPNKGAPWLQAYHAFLFEKRGSAEVFNRRGAVLRQLCKELGWKVELPILATSGEIALRTMAEVRKGATEKPIVKVVKRFLEVAGTDGKLRPRADALRTLHAYLRGQNLGQSVTMFVSMPYGDAEATISAAVKAKGGTATLKTTRRNRLLDLYGVAAEQGVSAETPPRKSEKLETPKKIPRTQVNAKVVIEQCAAQYAHNTVRALPTVLKRLALFLDTRSHGSRARSNHEALAHFLRLNAEQAHDVTADFGLWLQTAHGDKKAVSATVARVNVTHLARCAKVAKELGMITWEVPPVSGWDSTHEAGVAKLLGWARFDQSEVGRVVAAFASRNLGVVYSQARAMARMAQQLPKIADAPELGLAHNESFDVRQLVALLVEDQVSVDAAQIVGLYFRTMRRKGHAKPRAHLYTLSLALRTLAETAQSRGLHAGIAAHHVVLPYERPASRQDGAGKLIEALKVPDNTPDWVGEVVMKTLNNRALGEAGRLQRSLVLHRWARYLSKRRHTTVKQAVVRLVEQPQSIDPYLAELSSGVVATHARILRELIQRVEQHRPKR